MCDSLLQVESRNFAEICRNFANVALKEGRVRARAPELEVTAVANL